MKSINKTTCLRIKSVSNILLEELRLKMMKCSPSLNNISKQDIMHILITNAHQAALKKRDSESIDSVE